MTDQAGAPGGPINRVRRRDRAVEDEAWIRTFLRQARYGVVATECEGQPFVNPLTFVFDEESHCLYFHTSRAGRICKNVQQNPRVCFCASEMGRLMAAPRAADFDVEYASVVVFGRAQVLQDAVEAARALRLLVSKYFPDLRHGEDYQAVTPEQAARPAVYRLAIESWSAKRNAARPDGGA